MTPQPNVGSWYRFTGDRSGGELFEVVAVDNDDRTVEIQYFDGTIEEMDLEDWEAHGEDGELEAAEPPEDWSGSVDVEPEDFPAQSDEFEGDRRLGARPLDGLDRLE